MNNPPVYIHHIETQVPKHTYAQTYLCDLMQQWAQTEREGRYIRGIYPTSGIHTRHFVVSTDGSASEGIYFRNGPGKPPANPTTRQRNDLFAQAATPMAIQLARKTLQARPDIVPKNITHIIAISCTGFYNPGPDYHIARALNLSETVQRYNLGFMGCHAALPGLKMATQFCQANPNAVVLVLCLELCSLHLQFDGSSDSLLANALFSDGAATAIISARTFDKPPVYQLQQFASSLVPNSEKDMAWTVGDHGFHLTLSSYVSKLIAGSITDMLTPIFNTWHMSFPNINLWAVHPGGKTILDRVSEELDLIPDQMEASRTILKNHGNMSSATILFVLREMAQTNTSSQVCALAFGPGLTVESACLKLIDSHV